MRIQTAGAACAKPQANGDDGGLLKLIGGACATPLTCKRGDDEAENMVQPASFLFQKVQQPGRFYDFRVSLVWLLLHSVPVTSL